VILAIAAAGALWATAALGAALLLGRAIHAADQADAARHPSNVIHVDFANRAA
jgi:uncharacterized membrane protein YecN with MAPEG domain